MAATLFLTDANDPAFVSASVDAAFFSVHHTLIVFFLSLFILLLLSLVGTSRYLAWEFISTRPIAIFVPLFYCRYVVLCVCITLVCFCVGIAVFVYIYRMLFSSFSSHCLYY